MASKRPRCHADDVTGAVAAGDDRTLAELLHFAPEMVNETDVNGMSPLHTAAMCGTTSCARVLLHWGANIDLPDHLFRSPLFLACVRDHAECADIFIQHGGSTHQITFDGFSPLLGACANGSTRCIELLMQRGVTLEDTIARTTFYPIHVCMIPEGTRYLAALGSDIDQVDTNGNTPLATACIKGWSGVARVLLELGADAHRGSVVKNATPLALACANNHAQCAETLISFRADPNNGDVASPPLSIAIQHRATECVDTLIRHNADPNHPDTFGRAPLHHAARLGMGDTVVRLVSELGADPSLADAFGDTPLHHLALRCNNDADPPHNWSGLKALLVHGAPTNAQNKFGDTPLQHAKRNGSETAVLAHFVNESKTQS